jgi:hypothetical protein
MHPRRVAVEAVDVGASRFLGGLLDRHIQRSGEQRCAGFIA